MSGPREGVIARHRGEWWPLGMAYLTYRLVGSEQVNGEVEGQVTARAGERRLQDRNRLRSKVAKAAIAVVSNPEVDLHQRIEAVQLGEITQHREVDAVTLYVGDPFEGAASACVLTYEGLVHRGQVGEEGRDERPREQFGNPATFTHDAIEWAFVEALHELGRRFGQQWRYELGDDAWVEVDEVGVAVHHEVADARGKALPQRFALACAGADVGQDISSAYDSRPRGRGFLRCCVDRSVIDHENFVDQTRSCDQLSVGDPHDVAHAADLVFRWNDQRNSRLALDPGQRPRVGSGHVDDSHGVQCRARRRITRLRLSTAACETHGHLIQSGGGFGPVDAAATSDFARCQRPVR